MTHIDHSEKVLIMRTFLTVLILILNLQALSKADDISEFEIEGISIGDSLLQFFSEKEINSNLADWYKNNEYSTSLLSIENYETYKDLDVSFSSKDREYKIVSLAGIHVDAERENCKLIKREIVNEIRQVINNKNVDFEERVEIHPIDPSGKSNVDSSYFYYKNGDAIVVQCFFFSKNVKYDDGLKVSITTDEYVDWLENKAYN